MGVKKKTGEGALLSAYVVCRLSFPVKQDGTMGFTSLGPSAPFLLINHSFPAGFVYIWVPFLCMRSAAVYRLHREIATALSAMFAGNLWLAFIYLISVLSSLAHICVTAGGTKASALICKSPLTLELPKQGKEEFPHSPGEKKLHFKMVPKCKCYYLFIHKYFTERVFFCRVLHL